MRVTVIDYKAGNLTSVLKALRHLGAEVEVTDDGSSMIQNAERLVLPGVGHFAATRRLDETGMTPAIRDAIGSGIPFLGICVGMQWLYSGSSEASEQKGLAYFSESCARFPECGEKVPHVGWNSLDLIGASCLFQGVPHGAQVYFTHSYRAPISNATSATSTYIESFAAAVEDGNVMGVQFHPEKSSDTGLRILQNFLEWKAGEAAC